MLGENGSCQRENNATVDIVHPKERQSDSQDQCVYEKGHFPTANYQ